MQMIVGHHKKLDKIINQQNRQFEEQLKNIGENKTFYLQDWKQEKHWLGQQQLNQFDKPQLRNHFIHDKKHNQFKQFSPHNKSNSLPMISRVAVPLIQIDSQTNLFTKKLLQRYQFQSSQNLIFSQIAQRQQQQLRYFNKNIENEKNIIRKINNQKNKPNVSSNRKQFTDFHRNFDSLKIKQQKQHALAETSKHRMHTSTQNILPGFTNLSSSYPVIQGKINQTNRYQKNDQMPVQMIEFMNSIENKRKPQIKLTEDKINMKRQAINKILKKYGPNYGSERADTVKQNQKIRRKRLIQQIIQSKRTTTLHSSSLQKFMQLKKQPTVGKNMQFL